MELHERVTVFAEDFAFCTKILTALGDETRQYLILEMLKSNRCGGVRVCEITEKTNLSRTSVSHHLQILKQSGIVKVRKEGTKNFYYFDPDADMLKKLTETLTLATDIAKALPERHGE